MTRGIAAYDNLKRESSAIDGATHAPELLAPNSNGKVPLVNRLLATFSEVVVLVKARLQHSNLEYLRMA